MGALEQLRGSGFTLHMDGARLIVSPASRLTDELRALIRVHRDELIRELRPTRAIVEYRFAGDTSWYTMLGRPGDTFDEAAAACRRVLPEVIETRPREQLPAGFPFSSPCPDCDGSGCDTCGDWPRPAA